MSSVRLGAIFIAILLTISISCIPARAQDAGAIGGAIIGGIAAGILFKNLEKADPNRGRELRERARAQRQSLDRGRDPSAREKNRSIQVLLNSLGFNAGPADGLIGGKTRRAIKEFQLSLGREADGQLDQEEEMLLFKLSGELQVSVEMADALANRTSIVVDSRRRSELPTIVTIPSASNHIKTGLRSSSVMTTSDDLVGSRAFSGPDQFPPNGFGGYAVLVFKSAASEYDLERHLQICAAYVKTLPRVSEVRFATKSGLFVTLWPINSNAKADLLNESMELHTARACRVAVENYDLVTAQSVMRAARSSGFVASGVGPYILAWAPSENFEKNAGYVVHLNMSGVRNYDQALSVLSSWNTDFEGNLSVYKSGFSLERIRITIRNWADVYGESILGIVSGND